MFRRRDRLQELEIAFDSMCAELEGLKQKVLIMEMTLGAFDARHGQDTRQRDEEKRRCDRLRHEDRKRLDRIEGKH